MIRIPNRPKYGNKKRNGFDSNKEANRWQQLCFLERAGKIHDLKRQVKFELIPAQYQDGRCVERACSYIADFTYMEGNHLVVEDVKSPPTRRKDSYIIKRKLMRWVHHIKIRET